MAIIELLRPDGFPTVVAVGKTSDLEVLPSADMVSCVSVTGSCSIW